MNWKFIVPVVAVALAVAALVPGAAAAVLPLLIVAICPLAMVGGLALLARTGNNAGDSSTEVEQLRAEVSRMRGERPAETGAVR